MSLDTENHTVPKKSLVFGIDYDQTFAADPEMFKAFVGLIKAHGHIPVLVTGREDSHGFGEPVRALVEDLMPIVFAGGSWKRDAAKAAGYEVDIWIDDNPTYIAPPMCLKETLEALKQVRHPDIRRDRDASCGKCQ